MYSTRYLFLKDARLATYAVSEQTPHIYVSQPRCPWIVVGGLIKIHRPADPKKKYPIDLSVDSVFVGGSMVAMFYHTNDVKVGYVRTPSES